jgi:phospholipid-binding lipoprotein MlaA
MRRTALAAMVGATLMVGAPAAWAQSAQAPDGQAQKAQAAAVSPAPTGAAPTPGDPWERLNRANYAFETQLDRHLIGPIAHLYQAITPGPIGRGIHNILTNLSEPSVFINDVLQFRPRRAGETAARFVTNSTVGLLGLIDVATKVGLPHHDNEFGVTLGRLGVKPGPYMYLPVGGPTTVRDLVGTGVDLLLDPFHWARFAQQATVNGARLVTGGLDIRVASEGELNALLSDATDPYATLRSVYLQNKQSEIDGGAGPANLPDFDTPLPTVAPPAPGAAADSGEFPLASNMFPESASESASHMVSDGPPKDLADAAALRLMAEADNLPIAAVDRAVQLGRALGNVRGAERNLAATEIQTLRPADGSDADVAPASLDTRLASAD